MRGRGCPLATSKQRREEGEEGRKEACIPKRMLLRRKFFIGPSFHSILALYFITDQLDSWTSRLAMKIPVRTDQRRGGTTARFDSSFQKDRKGGTNLRIRILILLIEHRSTGRIFFDRLFDRVITKFRKSEQSSKETRERYFSARQDPRAEWEVY